MKSLRISFIEGTGKHCRYYLVKQGHKRIQQESTFEVDREFEDVFSPVRNPMSVNQIMETLEKEEPISLFGVDFNYEEPFGQSSGYYGGGYLLIMEVSYRLC